MRPICLAFAFIALVAASFADAPSLPLRLDIGTNDSPVGAGFAKSTAADMYAAGRGYGWEGDAPKGIDYAREIDWKKQGFFLKHMKEGFSDITADGVVSEKNLVFRADLPNGTYRVCVTIGDMTRRLGSMDLSINGAVVAEHVAAWSPGGDGGDQRRIMYRPNGWWWKESHTVDVKDGVLRIQLSKNQSFYDEQLKIQDKVEREWEDTYFIPPYKRVGVEHPPYYYIGWPFYRNAIMALEIAKDVPAPVVAGNDQLRLSAPIASAALNDAIAKFNAREFAAAVKALDGVTEEAAQPAKAVVALWLAGRLETEFDEDERLLAMATPILEKRVAAHPEEVELAEILEQAHHYAHAWHILMHSGDDPMGEANHFVEKARCINYFWLVPEGTPLYYSAQLNLARAEHKMLPYFPARGTYREVLKKLEKKFPDDRFVKYHLRETWENHGDGSKYHDWVMKDYAPAVKDAPEWVRRVYPAFQECVDWCDWWVRYRQNESAGLGGGWGDDVEEISILGYYAFVSNDISPLVAKGVQRFADTLYLNSEIDPELGYCVILTDSEHASEWTGDVLGMMMLIDYGNPLWIERSLKTGKLMRDLWTDYNDLGRRHIRSEYFSAAEVGLGDVQTDFWINYRALRPAHAVYWYNQNPTIGKTVAELADSWVKAAMSTDRGKPKGIIPGAVAFPSGLLGGRGTATWYGTDKVGEDDGGNFAEGGYKEYIRDLLFGGYRFTHDPAYLEPMRYEYELVHKFRDLPAESTGLRLEGIPVFGTRMKDRKSEVGKMAKDAPKPQATPESRGEPGSAEWAAYKLKGFDWLVAKRMLEGRKGPLKDDMSKEDIIAASKWFTDEMAWRWPLHTTEAGPTDRIGFVGQVNPFIIYTGGRRGGPFFEADVTYQNTTRDFAAAVLGTDDQGFRSLYYSLADGERVISLLPWRLEAGAKYKLRYGPDANDDGVMDSVTEEREFAFPQKGTPIPIKVKPSVAYLIEVDQTERGRGAEAAPDPALTASDLRYSFARILARVHNVGSKAARNVEVAAYEGDPAAGGKLIGRVTIPNIEAPIDLDPKTVTVGFPWKPADGQPKEIHIVVDPDNKLTEEITNMNNSAHAPLPREGDLLRRSPGSGGASQWLP